MGAHVLRGSPGGILMTGTLIYREQSTGNKYISWQTKTSRSNRYIYLSANMCEFKEFICEYNLFTQQHALLLFAINSFMLNCVFIPKAKIDFKIELLCKCKNYKEYIILDYETFDVSLSSH